MKCLVYYSLYDFFEYQLAIIFFKGKASLGCPTIAFVDVRLKPVLCRHAHCRDKISSK